MKFLVIFCVLLFTIKSLGEIVAQNQVSILSNQQQQNVSTEIKKDDLKNNSQRNEIDPTKVNEKLNDFNSIKEQQNVSTEIKKDDLKNNTQRNENEIDPQMVNKKLNDFNLIKEFQ